MLIQKKLLEQLISLASDSAEYLNEKWITVKPHGAESKGTHVLVKDGETSKEAVERKFDSKTKEPKQEPTKLELDAFRNLLREKFPRINKNVIDDYMKVNKMRTMKDFLNKYKTLNQETIKKLHTDIMDYLFS